MPAEVVQAMSEIADCYVDVDDLNRRAGAYIAELTGADGGIVTAGCAAAQMLQAAACMTGIDEDRIRQLPDTAGMRNRVLVQRAHRNKYDLAYRLSGAEIVDFGTEESATLVELEEAIDRADCGGGVRVGDAVRQPSAGRCHTGRPPPRCTRHHRRGRRAASGREPDAVRIDGRRHGGLQRGQGRPADRSPPASWPGGAT